jgi:hypothetical protein
VVEAALSAAWSRRVVVVWGLLALLLAAIGALEWVDHRRARSGDAEADARRLVPVPVDQLGAMEVADAGRLHRFERGPDGAWFYHGVHTPAEASHEHVPDPALAERIERAVAAFGRARVERSFPAGKDAPDYGVTAPEVLVLLYRPRESQPLAQYAVGHLAPDTVSRYVTIVGRPDVVTIPSYQIDNLLALARTAAEASGPRMPAPGAPGAGTTGAGRPGSGRPEPRSSEPGAPDRR